MKRHNILLTRTSVKCREIKIVRELKKKKKKIRVATSLRMTVL